MAIAQEGITLDTITVFGEKFATPLDQTATSVLIHNAKDIDKRSADTVFDLLESAPNVEISRDDRDVVIRGVSKDGLGQTQDILTQSQSDLISIYLDGASISTWAGATSTWDLQQVEILRGVQTNTFGRGALAGAIVLKSADPVHEFQARMQGSYADPDRYSIATAVNLPVVQDIIALRFALEHSDKDGTIRNPARGTLEDPDRHLTLRGKALIEPSEQVRALISVNYSNRERGSGFVNLATFPGARIATGDRQNIFTNDLLAASSLVSFEAAPGWLLEAETAFTQEDAERALDGDATPFPVVTARVNEDLTIVSQEARAKYDPEGGRLSGFAGVNLRHFERDIHNRVPAFFLDFMQDLKAQSLGLFGEVRYKVTNNVEIYAGGRFDVEHIDFRSSTNPSKQSETFEALSPKFGVAVDVTENVRLIGEVEKGRRAGGAGVSLLSATAFTFGEESTWNYEATARTTWLDGTLKFDASFFYVDWEDQQVEALTAIMNPFDTVITNAGKSSKYGVEAQTVLQATEDLRFNAALGWLRTSFDSFVTSGLNLTGNEFPNAPEFSTDFGVLWQPVSGPLEGFFASGNVAWRGRYFSDVQNTPTDRVGDRTLVSLGAGYEWENAKIKVYVRNLLDERYLTVSTTGLGTGAAGAPREVGVVGEIRL